MFFNQLLSGHNLASIPDELLTALTNISMYTYKIASIYTLIENAVLDHLLSLAGLAGSEIIFCPGGSLSNITAFITARHYVYKNIRKKGTYNSPSLAIFVSNEAHYSIERAAIVAGLGRENVFKIDSDNNSKIIADSLRQTLIAAKKNNLQPHDYGNSRYNG